MTTYFAGEQLKFNVKGVELMSQNDLGFVPYSPYKERRCSACSHGCETEQKDERRLMCSIMKILVEPYAFCKTFLKKKN